jgi:predicted metal-dependent RNase
MLVGGAAVEYFKEFASSSANGMCLSCYQPAGGLGRQLKEGLKETTFNINGKDEKVPIRLKFISIDGFSGHSSRNELMALMNSINPKPRKVIVNHGEVSKSLDFASSIYKSHRIETVVPKNLETIRLK